MISVVWARQATWRLSTQIFVSTVDSSFDERVIRVRPRPLLIKIFSFIIDLLLGTCWSNKLPISNTLHSVASFCKCWYCLWRRSIVVNCIWIDRLCLHLLVFAANCGNCFETIRQVQIDRFAWCASSLKESGCLFVLLCHLVVSGGKSTWECAIPTDVACYDAFINRTPRNTFRCQSESDDASPVRCWHT